MVCTVCGANAPTEYVELHQNIGFLIARQSRSVRGELCRKCIDEHFWRFTLTTIAIGWLGVISFFIAPIYVIGNIIQFAKTRNLEASYTSRRVELPPTLTLSPEARAKLAPFADELRARLDDGEPLADAAYAVARKATVSAAQAEAFARELAGPG